MGHFLPNLPLILLPASILSLRSCLGSGLSRSLNPGEDFFVQCAPIVRSARVTARVARQTGLKHAPDDDVQLIDLALFDEAFLHLFSLNPTLSFRFEQLERQLNVVVNAQVEPKSGDEFHLARRVLFPQFLLLLLG